MARRPYTRSSSMGSGRVRLTPDRTLVHFGSPEGTSYSKNESSETNDDFDDSWDDVAYFQKTN